MNFLLLPQMCRYHLKPNRFRINIDKLNSMTFSIKPVRDLPDSGIDTQELSGKTNNHMEVIT